MFKELPVFVCENDVTKATNYLVTALAAYKATTEVIFNRLLKYKDFSWNHQAIFTLIRSASSILLLQLLGEFYDLKSKLWESEENIINDTKGRTIEEKTTNVINWFMFNDVSNEPKTSTLFDSKTVDTVKGGKRQK